MRRVFLLRLGVGLKDRQERFRGGQRAIGLQLLDVSPILCVGERHRHRFRTYKLVFHNAAEQIGGVVGMVELLGAGCGLDNGCDLG